MALGVDLFGYDATGVVAWHRMCRWWEGDKLLDLLGSRLQDADPPPAWEMALSVDEVNQLEARFRVPEKMRAWYVNDPDLGELLQRPGTDKIVLRIEEWGYG